MNQGDYTPVQCIIPSFLTWSMDHITFERNLMPVETEWTGLKLKTINCFTAR